MSNDRRPTPEQTEPVEVTLIIPCLNEAETIVGVIEDIHHSFTMAGYSYEVLVADNGSTDGSQPLSESVGARVVTVTQRGYGAALLGGIANAAGKYAVMGDADGSYRFADALPMIQQLQEGSHLVIGNRFSGGIAPGAMPWLHRYLGNPVLSALGRLFFRVRIRDFHCGLRAFDVNSIRSLKLRSPGMEFASEMVVLAQKSGLRIDEVPVRLEPDKRSRPPHLRTWRDGWRHLRFLFAHSPTWTFLLPAAIAAVLALLITLLGLLGPIRAWSIEFSFRTAIVASALAVVSATAAWSFVLAKSVLKLPTGRLTYWTEKSAGIALLSVAVGLTVVFSQILSWSKSGFGLETIDGNLLITIWGCLMISLGGISFFFSLLIGLVRTLR